MTGSDGFARTQVAQAFDAFQRARMFEQAGQIPSAIGLYQQAAAKSQAALKQGNLHESLMTQARQVSTAALAQVQKLQAQAQKLQAQGVAPRPALGNPPGSARGARPIARGMSNLVRPPPGPALAPEVSGMESAIITERPNVKFSDVAGLDVAKHLLNEAVIMPLKLPELYVGPTRPWAGILLYGPPGTGKSFLAKAVAGEATNTTFLTVSNADLTSKWVGESEKLVRSLFETARRSRPSVVFIDEIDALVSARGENESESGKRIKTEFLVQMDGVGSHNEGVLIIAATNLPWDLDQAMLRRFERRIYIPLPDLAAREVLIRNKLRDASHSLTEKDYQIIAKGTDGYSGADLATLIRDALMQPIREFEEAEMFEQKEGVDLNGNRKSRLWVPVPPSLQSVKKGRRCKWDQLPKEELARPIARLDHFKASLRRMRPSVDRKFLARYDQWTRELGESGVR